MMEKEDLAVGGAFGASLLVGACCVAPALFLLFGVSVGGLGMLTRLEPYRPIFMAVGGGALLYAAWRAWRPAPSGAAACADESCAPGSPRRRRTRRLVTVVVILYGLAIVYPYALAALY